MEKTFFDYIGVSDMERIHSATIAWMISDICKVLTIQERTQILNTLFVTQKTDLTSIETITEFEHIDIAFITTDRNGNKELWFLENKVKAPLGYNQLKKYTNDLVQDIEKHFSVLSLIGILPQDDLGNWHLATYSQLLHTLTSICTEITGTRNHQMAIIEEYCNCISNLIFTLSEFKKEPHKYTNVFTDGNKTKASKAAIKSTDIRGYIANNALETLCQKFYFTDIVNEIKSCNTVKFNSCHVSETRGNADFAFHFGSFGNDNTYVFDLSFQNGAFKLAVSKEYYPKLTNQTKEELKKWATAFSRVRSEFPNYARLNKPRGRARISISYNIGSKWYNKYNRSEFINLVISQIHIAHQIAEKATRIRESIV